MAHLPVSRVKTIMKTTDGVDKVSKEAIQLVTRAAELFIQKMTSEAYCTANNAKKINYEHLVNVVHNRNQYDFLELMIPRKITVSRFKAMMTKKVRHVTADSESTTESSDEDDTNTSGSSKDNC